MEDSTLLVQRTKNKFYETKNLVDTKLGDHLSRSRSLLSDVNSTLKRNTNNDSMYSQRYFVDSFAPFKENGLNDNYRCNNEAFRCNTRLVSPTFTFKNNSALGLSETPKHMTQAMWLLNTSNVSCKLSNNLLDEEQEKIPDILLKDPADLLRGDKDNNDKQNKEKENKDDDKLTELLKYKYEDFRNENDLKNQVQDKYKNSISYDIVSTLDFSKKTVDNKNVYGSNDFVNKLFNDSYINLEKLSQMFNNNQNDFKGFENFCKNKNDWNEPSKNNSLNKLNEMFKQEFVNNSGIDFKQQSDTLTETLFKLNERDRLKESELAPKVFLNDDNDLNKKMDQEGEKTEFKNEPVFNLNTGITGLETDLLGSFTIIKDDKTGRKMYRLSDFDQKFKSSTKATDSVQVQTEFEEPEPVTVNKKFNSNVKVMYHNLYEGKNDLNNKVNNLKKQDLYAQQLVSNLVPRVEMKMYNYDNDNYNNDDNEDRGDNEYGFEVNKVDKNNVLEKVKEYNEWLKTKDEEKMKNWRTQREPIFNLLNLNLKTGVRQSRMCRGGRRNSSSVVHKTKMVKEDKEKDNNRNGVEKEEKDELYYISPSNRKSIDDDNYYGYDLGYEDLEQKSGLKGSNKVNNNDKYRMVVKNVNSEVNKGDNKNLNPLDHFEQWWSINTEELNMLREQLSM